MKMGRLIATLDPLRVRIFAVKVLIICSISMQYYENGLKYHSRETGMGVGDLLREKETVARLCVLRVEVWFREDALDAETGERSEGHRYFVHL